MDVLWRCFRSSLAVLHHLFHLYSLLRGILALYLPRHDQIPRSLHRQLALWVLSHSLRHFPQKPPLLVIRRTYVINIEQWVVVASALVPSLQLPHSLLLQKVLYDRLSPNLLRYRAHATRHPHHPPITGNLTLHRHQALFRALEKRLPLRFGTTSSLLFHRSVHQYFPHQIHHHQRSWPQLLCQVVLWYWVGRLRACVCIQRRFRHPHDRRLRPQLQVHQQRTDGRVEEDLLLWQDHRILKREWRSALESHE